MERWLRRRPPTRKHLVPPRLRRRKPKKPIVATGIHARLAHAAEIKRDAPQVVDSTVAQDIGKFPDPMTAAAPRRVPGVQVTVGGNNEIVNPLIRGLGDILTTLDGREIFTAEGPPRDAVSRSRIYRPKPCRAWMCSSRIPPI